MTKQTPQETWRVVGSSVIGTSHLKIGTPCQDAFAYEQLPTGTLIIALADGAGSATLAEDGAQKAVQAAVSALKPTLTAAAPSDEAGWQSVISQTFSQARQALIEMAQQSQQPLRDYAATLLVVILHDNWTVGGMVGDSVAVTMDESEQLAVLGVPQKGEYANTTNFLTQENALEVLEVVVQPQSSHGVAVFSDGLQALAVNIAQNRPHAPFFTPLFAFTAAVTDTQSAEQQLADFLNSDRVNARTDDDKTLVLARRC